MKKIKQTNLYKKVFANVAIFAVLFLLFPMPTFAASSCTGTPGPLNIESSNVRVGDVLNYGTCLIQKSIIPLLFSVAMAVFLYGIVMFIKEDNTEKKEEGRNFMIWGVVAMAVMMSVWGLVSLLTTTFGIDTVIPQLPISTTR
ncbi:MAG: hypothetical protein WCO65_02755 [bacterium]